jgi:hypothetical protein
MQTAAVRSRHYRKEIAAPEKNRSMRTARTFQRWIACVAVAILLSSPSRALGFMPDETASRGPRKLLAWQGSVDDPNAGEEGLYGDRIITDRPHLAEAASTVGLGRVQVETGYTYFTDGSGGTSTQTQSFPEPLFRIGLFREWFEFRLQYNYFHEQTDTATTRTVLQGSDDLYVGAKIGLVEQAGILPELTIFPQMRTPTGGPAFTAGEVLPGMNFVYAWRVTERFEIECNTNVNRRRNPGLDHFYTEYLQTFNFEYDLMEQVMLFNEFVIFSPVGGINVPGQAYSHGGLHYFLLPNLQIDVHAAVGLNGAADDFFGGSGVSCRW